MPPTKSHTTNPQPPYDHLAAKAQIARMETRLIRWIVGVAIAQAIALGSMILTAIIYLS